VHIGVSVGVTHARPGDTSDDILTRAGLAMYQAKMRKEIGFLSFASA
jgi:GGDEF domain-containing protein